MLDVWGTPILAEVNDILTVLKIELGNQGIEVFKDMKPTSRNIMVTCPFHEGSSGIKGDEKKPSCGITTVETTGNDGKKYPAGTVHCFTCDYKADLAGFISNVSGHLDQGMFGYKWITSRYAAVSVEKRQPLVLNMSRERKLATDVHYVTEEELASYRFMHDYMYYRKLTDKVINYFDVGYDKDKHSLTFPVHDLQGNVLFVQRRYIEQKGFLNEDSVQKGQIIYGLYHVYKNLSWIKEVIVCESIIDALTCWTHRVAAVALLGALPTEKQINLLKGLPVRKLVSGLDNDKAGQKGNEKLKKELSSYKILQKILFPEGVKDINDMTEEQFVHRAYGNL